MGVASVHAHCDRETIQVRSSREGAHCIATVTPDGRYLIVRGRLWRAANPALPASTRDTLVRQLMQARRDVKDALGRNDPTSLRGAREAVQAAKVALGERGPVWWSDGARDYNRYLVKNTPYAK